MSIRVQGKAGFAHLQQGGKRLQIYVKLDFVGEKAFQLYKLLDIGDYIGVKGYLFRTRTERADGPRRRDHLPGEGPASACPRSGTDCRISRRATAAVMSISP